MDIYNSGVKSFKGYLVCLLEKKNDKPFFGSESIFLKVHGNTYQKQCGFLLD